MYFKEESHLPDSPVLLKIVEAKQKGLPYVIGGKKYDLCDWHGKEGRVIVKFRPWGESHART